MRTPAGLSTFPHKRLLAVAATFVAAGSLTTAAFAGSVRVWDHFYGSLTSGEYRSDVDTLCESMIGSGAAWSTGAGAYGKVVLIHPNGAVAKEIPARSRAHEPSASPGTSVGLGEPVGREPSSFSKTMPLDIDPGSYRELAEFTTAGGKSARVFIGRSRTTGKTCHGMRSDDVIGYACGEFDDLNGVHAVRTTVLDETFVSGLVGANVARVEAQGSDQTVRQLPVRNRAFFLEARSGQTLVGFDQTGRSLGTDRVLPSAGSP